MEALSGNHVTIVFYGKVEDQTGNPVVNAVVSFDVRVLNGYESTVKRGQQTTDANGFFTISGYKGQDLTVIPQKEGYTLGTTRTLFTYSHLSEGYFVPDAGNPTVIKMWKLQGADHLIHYQTEVRVPIDGTPVTFDFQTGQRVQTGGDVRVRIETTPTPNVIQRYDWHATIQAVNGGLITSDADFDRMFMAPDSGYQPEITNSYQRDIKPWSTTFNGVFYFTSRNGSSYGKLGIEVLSDVVKNATVPVILNSYVNPASSRNLEIDPKLVTEAHP